MPKTNELSWKTEVRRLGDLVKWKKNPRQLSEEQAVRLRESISEFGYSQLYEIEPDNTIIDGHQREEIMLRMAEFGPDSKIEVRVSSRKLELNERKKYIVMKHQGARGEWDWPAMEDLYNIDELLEWGFDKKEIKIERKEIEIESKIYLDQAIQLKPPSEYVLIMCDSLEEFEKLREVFDLGLVRKGGYKAGSPFDQTGTQRVITAGRLFEVLENASSDSE